MFTTQIHKTQDKLHPVNTLQKVERHKQLPKKLKTIQLLQHKQKLPADVRASLSLRFSLRRLRDKGGMPKSVCVCMFYDWIIEIMCN